MDPREHLLHVYKELADRYEKHHQPPMRDRFLVLAADAALLANRPDEAETLRLRLLRLNPHHMLKPFASFTQALKAPDVLTYIKDLRVNYPANVAEDLLGTVQTEEKRPPGSNPAVAATSAVPIASEEMFVNSNDAPRDLAPTAPPAALPTPYDIAHLRPDSRPQTLPLQVACPETLRAAGSTATRTYSASRRHARPFAARRPSRALRTAAEPSAHGGSWLTVLLFLVVLASGAALVAFTFLRPYLSMH